MFSHQYYRAFLISLVILVQCVSSLPYYTAITSKLQKIVLLYPGQARSERDLDVCTDSGVCSIVHQRLWFPHQVEILCRCQNKEECPYEWTEHDDNRTLLLNNRSQMKICDRTDEMLSCRPEQTALIVNETISEVLKERKVQATAFCNCKHPAHWTLQRHFHNVLRNATTQTSSHYHCTKLAKCKEEEHCGNVRLDYFSTYQHCSCPKGRFCLINNKIETNVTELLYFGPSYRAYCSTLNLDSLDNANKLPLNNNTISEK